jgi:glutamine synthetase
MNNGVRGYDPTTDLQTWFDENNIKVVKFGAPDME